VRNTFDGSYIGISKFCFWAKNLGYKSAQIQRVSGGNIFGTMIENTCMAQSELIEYQSSWCLGDIMNTINSITSILRITRVATIADNLWVSMNLDFAQSERPDPFCRGVDHLRVAASKWYAPAKQNGAFPYDFVDNSSEVLIDEKYQASFFQPNTADRTWLVSDTTVPGDTWYLGKITVWVMVTFFLFKN
jgi:hypothetical protein